MNEIRIIITIFLVAFCSSLLAKENGRLNFVFILADDLGVNDIAIEGSAYETPNIDKLAASGVRFTQGYSTCQVCSPSRASILTGKYPASHGITDYIGAPSGLKWKRNDKVLPAEYIHALPAEDISLAEAMKSAGYQTFFAGKWHLGGEGSLPTDHGFDINMGGNHRGGPYTGGYFGPFNNPNLKVESPKGEPLPIRLANETVKFIEDNQDRPFFAYLSFYSVHAPLQTTEALWNKYKSKVKKENLDQPRFIFDRTKAVRQVQDHPVYAGMMELMDDAVGIVLNKLKVLDLEKNTVVIFTGDNGSVSSGDAFATSCLPLRGGKGRQWEGGTRVPYYIHVPGKLTGVLNSTPVSGADFYPTILDLAGVEIDKSQQVDGVSITPLLQGKTLSSRNLYWHYPHYGNQGGEPSAIIRSGKWKLIHYYEDGRNELYNLDEDVGEQENIESQLPEISNKLSESLQSWLIKTNASIPKKDDRFNSANKLVQLETAKTKAMQNLEKRHRVILNAGWKPNANWWGTNSTKD